MKQEKKDIRIELFSEVDNELYYNEEKICSFVPRMLYIIEGNSNNTDTKKGRYKYLITCVAPGYNELPAFAFYKFNIDYSAHWYQCNDACLSKYDKELIKFYLLEQSKGCKAKKELLIDRLGDYPQCYVFDHDTIFWKEGVDQDSYFLDIDPGLPVIPLCKVNRMESLKYVFRLMSLQPYIMIPLLSAKFYAALKDLFHAIGKDEGFYLNINGFSGRGKSTLAKLLFVQIKEQELSFKGLKKETLEKALKMFRGNTILIDDYHPEAKDYLKKAQISLQDTISRRSDNGDTPFIVMTSELLEGTFSTQDRMVLIIIDEPVPEYDAIIESVQNKGIFNTFIHIFIEEVVSQRGEIIQYLSKFIGNHLDYAKRSRICMSLTLMSAAFHVFSDIFLTGNERVVFMEELGTDNIERLITPIWKKIQSNQETHLKRIVDIDTPKDLVEDIYRILHSNIFETMYSFKYADNSTGKCIIIRNEDEWYITNIHLKTGLERYYRKKVSINPYLDELSKENILITDKSGKREKKKKNKYYYVLDINMLEEYHKEYLRLNSV